MSVQNSDWSLQQDNPIFREPDPPVNTDSDSGHRPVQGYEDTSAQAPTSLSLGPPCPDISQASNWSGFRTLLQQLPPQDSDERYCLALGEEELAQLRLFCAQRKQKSLGQGVARLLPPKLEGHTCEKCKKLLNPGEYGVFAARAGERCCWHRPCFACQACGQALTNLIYFYHDGHLYCGRHHAELLRPRCPACDQLIFSQRCTEAEGRRWHENHFCCQDCAGPLNGGRYALPGGSPCCPSCFARRYRSGGSSSVGAAEGQASFGASIGARILTARPWPASSKGLLNPPGGLRRRTRSQAGEAVAHWWTEAGAPGVDWRQWWRARHSLGRGGRPHATLARLLHRDLGALSWAFLMGLEQEKDLIQASAGTVPPWMTRSPPELRSLLQWQSRVGRPNSRIETAHRHPEIPKRTAPAPPAPLPLSRNPKAISSASAFQIPGRPLKTSKQMTERSPGSIALFVSGAAWKSG